MGTIDCVVKDGLRSGAFSRALRSVVASHLSRALACAVAVAAAAWAGGAGGALAVGGLMLQGRSPGGKKVAGARGLPPPEEPRHPGSSESKGGSHGEGAGTGSPAGN